MLGYLTIAGFLLAFCMVANRLSRSILTAPMVFIAFGVLLAEAGGLPAESTEPALHVVAEIALIVLLFLDAAQIDQRALLRRQVWPTRMLLIGMPAAFLLGTALGVLAFPGWPLALVALVAAILTPTDAALGQAVVMNPDVPERPRRALTVESGLNDGLALPLVLMMAALAAPGGTAPPEGWVAFGLKQVTLGPLVGLAIGYVGGVVLMWAKSTEATADVFEGIGALALAATAYLAASLVGGNGFISAFTAGLGFGYVVNGRCKFVLEFTEGDGQLLSWSAFFLLGAVLVPDAVAHLTLNGFIYICASLLIVRPVAIYLALVGSDAAPYTRLFFGWFGPRGLATALFALLVAGQLADDAAEDVVFLAVNAVWISAILHGVTAVPGARLYARLMRDQKPDAEMAAMPHPFSAGAGPTGNSETMEMEVPNERS